MRTPDDFPPATTRTPRLRSVALVAAVALAPSAAMIPAQDLDAVPAATVVFDQQVDCRTPRGPAVVFHVEGHEPGQDYWARTTSDADPTRTFPVVERFRWEGQTGPQEPTGWHAEISQGSVTVEILPGDSEGPTGPPLASGTFVADCTYVSYPDLPTFGAGQWDVPADDDQVSWSVSDAGELIATTPVNSLLSDPIEDWIPVGLTQTTSLNYGSVPTTAAGSVHFTGTFAGYEWQSPPCWVGAGGGGLWVVQLVSYWGTDNVSISVAPRDGVFDEYFTGDLGASPGPANGLQKISSYGSVHNWWDSAVGPFVFRATDNATGEVIGQRAFTEFCTVEYDPLEQDVLDVPDAPGVGPDGQWVVPEWDETFQWVVLMDGTLQVRLLPAWSTFPDGEVTHNFGLPAGSTPDPAPVVDRVQGEDRYATAAGLVLADYAPGLDTVYLASGREFPDALAGAALAGAQDAPVLLTRPDRLPDATRSALASLAPQHVVVLGGPAAVDDAVLDEITTLGLDATRLFGSNRYATAAAVSAELSPASTAFVASGLGYPDALAGAGAAGAAAAPVLLTRQDRLPAAAADELARHQPDTVYVLGGTTAVSGAVVEQIEALGLTVVRVGGTDRYGTAAAVAALHGESGFSHAWVASGRGFADALSAAPLAGREDGAILLTRPGSLPQATATALLAGSPERVTVLGGESAVGAEVAQAITDLAWE